MTSTTTKESPGNRPHAASPLPSKDGHLLQKRANGIVQLPRTRLIYGELVAYVMCGKYVIAIIWGEFLLT
jgi:hypothetical protein